MFDYYSQERQESSPLCCRCFIVLHVLTCEACMLLEPMKSERPALTVTQSLLSLHLIFLSVSLSLSLSLSFSSLSSLTTNNYICFLLHQPPRLGHDLALPLLAHQLRRGASGRSVRPAPAPPLGPQDAGPPGRTPTVFTNSTRWDWTDRRATNGAKGIATRSKGRY